VTTFVVGDKVLGTVGRTVVTTVVGTAVGARVNSVVGTTVEIVVGRVVTGSCAAGWVHAVKATKAIRRIIKLITFFIKSKWDSRLIKVTYLLCDSIAQSTPNSG
jgi:hypothetical protein